MQGLENSNLLLRNDRQKHFVLLPWLNEVHPPFQVNPVGFTRRSVYGESHPALRRQDAGSKVGAGFVSDTNSTSVHRSLLANLELEFQISFGARSNPCD